jgi:hypothetical protein
VLHETNLVDLKKEKIIIIVKTHRTQQHNPKIMIHWAKNRLLKFKGRKSSTHKNNVLPPKFDVRTYVKILTGCADTE